MMALGTLIAVGGPTASGKTSLAVALAKKFNTEIISADSRQFFKELSIGTAKPTPHEMAGITHHFVGHLSIQDAMSAGDFASEALPIIRKLLATNGVAVLVGGSGLYMDAVCFGLDDLPKHDEALRNKLNQLDIDALQEKLRALDPQSLEQIDIQNPHRLIRAIEVSTLSGQPFSQLKKGKKARTDFKLRRLAIDHSRAQLYSRINERVDFMIEQGLIEEAKRLLPYRDLNALKTVGYKELFSFFDGDFSEAQSIAKIKQHTRNYAKRQLTWMRRENAIEWIPAAELSSFLAHFSI